MSDRYVLLKRDLFERPEHKGYTGVRDQAGVWSCERLPTGIPIRAAYDRWSTEHYALPLEAAPEFTQACYEDVARNYLRCQRDDADARIAALEAQLAVATSPEYLAEKIEQVGMVDIEWQHRAKDLEAQLAERVTVENYSVLRPLLDYFEKLEAAPSNEHPRFPGGVRPFSSGDIRHFVHELRRILSALEATPPAPSEDGSMTPEEIHLENLKQMASYSGPVVSFDVREPYYLASCNHCGWVGSTELCGTDSYGDDSDVYCPRCHASGADCGKVAARIATPPAPKVTEAMVRMTISETIRAMGANPDEQLIGELTVFDAVAAKVRSALTAALKEKRT